MLKTVIVQGFFHVTADEINRKVNFSMLKTVIVQGFFHVTTDEINREVNSSMLKTVPGSRRSTVFGSWLKMCWQQGSCLVFVDLVCRKTLPNASLQVMLKLGRQQCSDSKAQHLFRLHSR